MSMRTPNPLMTLCLRADICILDNLAVLRHLADEPVKHSIDECTALLAEELGDFHILIDCDSDRDFRESLSLRKAQHNQRNVNAV